jgi:hypothetical protein
MVHPKDYVYVVTEQSDRYTTYYEMIPVADYECTSSEFFTYDTFPYADRWKWEGMEGIYKWVFNNHWYLSFGMNLFVQHPDIVNADSIDAQRMLSELEHDGDRCEIPNASLLKTKCSNWVSAIKQSTTITQRGDTFTRRYTKQAKIQPYYNKLLVKVVRIVGLMFRPMHAVISNADNIAHRVEVVNTLARVVKLKQIIDYSAVVGQMYPTMQLTKFEIKQLRKLFKDPQASLNETGTITVPR